MSGSNKIARSNRRKGLRTWVDHMRHLAEWLRGRADRVEAAGNPNKAAEMRARADRYAAEQGEQRT